MGVLEDNVKGILEWTGGGGGTWEMEVCCSRVW